MSSSQNTTIGAADAAITEFFSAAFAGEEGSIKFNPNPNAKEFTAFEYRILSGITVLNKIHRRAVHVDIANSGEHHATRLVKKSFRSVEVDGNGEISFRSPDTGERIQKPKDGDDIVALLGYVVDKTTTRRTLRWCYRTDLEAALKKQSEMQQKVLLIKHQTFDSTASLIKPLNFEKRPQKIFGGTLAEFNQKFSEGHFTDKEALEGVSTLYAAFLVKENGEREVLKTDRIDSSGVDCGPAPSVLVKVKDGRFKLMKRTVHAGVAQHGIMSVAA